eukprot:CAMPEP_0185027458 /NCGR_PEP_ID=MMETSP1103-20130426/12521_1 /TAXON_ID=36769 /ORGANISM="Paraphysomonas bandaiensis, Strain Caron Lab Isolate" /LENGTH=447 /DNA_ID=CAMNT_0027561465 /DNA_START=156 /DNA_END=1499 /DNA_ORIENTATION=+
MKTDNPDINGCLTEDGDICSNPMDPHDPSSSLVYVDSTAVYQQSDPSHSISGTTSQVYGASDSTPDMKGFVASYTSRTDTSTGPTIMKCFAPDHVPAITTLAKEYAMFDGWFASVPGPTQVNRAYAASATSNGMGTNDVELMIRGFPQKTMFRQIEEMGLDYRVYFEQIPSVLEFKDMRRQYARKSYRYLDKLYSDLAAGDMPQYSWVEPKYYDTPLGPATDQHPDHDVSAGDQLIKDIYESLRSSPLWNSTALVITYDEHGGFFDHVPPPTGVPNPDGKNATDDPFDFTRLGVRVPSVVVSPWVKKGTVVHSKPQGEGQYEHASIISTVVHKLFQPIEGHEKPEYLTARDQWAATFEWLFDELDEPRVDCPTTLPEIPSHRELFPGTLPELNGQQKVTELQREFLAVAAGASNDRNFDYGATEKWTELDAAKYVEDRMKIFFSNLD